jgi:hypothetical protein
VVPAGTSAQRLVLETRSRQYPVRRAANRIIRITDSGKKKEVFIDDPGGAGQEIVREVVVCPSCAARRNGG